MASEQVNKIGIGEIIDALPTLTMAEVKQLATEAKKSITEHAERDKRQKAERLLPVCIRIMEEIEPRVTGAIMGSSRERIVVNSRRMIEFYLFDCANVPTMIVHKIIGRSYVQVMEDIEIVGDWFNMPKAYASECSQYQMFKFRMSEEIKQR